MFNVILFTDTPEPLTKTRGYGSHRLASQIRSEGYTCLVVDFISAMTYDMYKDILNNAVGKETYVVGFSSSWLPYLMLEGETPQTADPGRAVNERRRGSDEILLKPNIKDPFEGSLLSAFVNKNAGQWFNYVKELNSKTKVVLGGNKIDWYTDIKEVDHFMIGLSETMMIDLLDSISKRGPRRIFNKIIEHDTRARLPKWDFRESTTSYTEYDFIKPNETLSLELSRGCRYKCSYCSYPMIGQKNMEDYLKYSETLKKELLENYERWGTTQYYFMDDTFNDTTEKLLSFLDVVNSLPFKISFWCYLRLDVLAVHPEQIQILKDLGLGQCYMGLETFHPKASKAIGKGMSASRRKETLKLCKEVWGPDVSIQAGFMVGLPHESSDSIYETAKYLSDPECPITQGWVFSLSIVGNHNLSKYVYKSEFDTNHEKYGYKIPNPDRFWEWYKEDETDITSWKVAEEVSTNAHKIIVNKVYKGDFYKASLNHPVLSNRKLTMSMTDKEYKDLIDSVDQLKLYTDTVMQDYFNPLIEKLKNANTAK
jgi:hypothetical protein